MQEIVEFEDKEIEILEYYTSRKSHKYLDYEEINKFLRYLFDSKDDGIGVYFNSAKVIGMIEGIKNLYSLSCKYGLSHDIPPKIYRQDYHYRNILSHKDIKSNIWIAESFLSFSKKLEETEQFKAAEHSKLVIATVEDANMQPRRIPFIDVTDILGKDEYYDRDEMEILIPPFTITEFSSHSVGENDEYYKIRILPQNYIGTIEDKTICLDDTVKNFIELSQQYDHTISSKTKLNEARRKLKKTLAKELARIKLKIMIESPQIIDNSKTIVSPPKNEDYER